MNIRQLRAVTVTLIVLGALVAVLAAGVVVQQVAASRLSRQIAREKTAIAKITGDTTNGAALEQNYQRLSTKLGGRSRDASWSSRMPFMMNQLNGIFEADKLKIETLKPDPVTAIDGVSRLPLRIGFKANLADLANVVREIEKTNPILNIESLDIRSNAGSEQLQIDMTVASFAVVDKNAPVVKVKLPMPPKPVEKAEKVPQMEKGKVPAPAPAAVQPTPTMPPGPMGQSPYRGTGSEGRNRGRDRR